MTTAYCVKEKTKKEIVSPKVVTMKNGRKAVSGACPSCGKKLYKILGNS